ncbi:uncharacterized protein LOC143290211 [Babylonia areolata]|uniref:uncharacterized protein LOC143290211 n=1 Tax=Babylonia areolata TaxID=304850 RepID=UPI003FD21305
MKWKESKMTAKGESSGHHNNDATPTTYSPLTRKTSGLLHHHQDSYSPPQQVADACTTSPYSQKKKDSKNSSSQYDALPIGTLGTYDPAADEIDYSFYQNARPNRRRLLYCRSLEADAAAEEEPRSGDGGPVVNGNGRRKHRGRKEMGWARGGGGGGAGGSGSEAADMAEDSLMEEAELSTETLYVMLLVLASTAVTMLAAYLILL